MKRTFQLGLALSICLTLVNAHAQFGGRGPSGPDFSGAMSKLFGENSAFASDVQVEAKGGPQGDMSMPGKISYLDGKSRFDLDMTQIKGANLPPQAVEQMKQMGMDKMTTISIPKEKRVYMIYPTLKSYAEMPVPNSNGDSEDADFNIELTELGKEEVDGHACIKNKAVIKDKEGKANEFTVWNATDLKKFPVKIVTAQNGMDVTLSFKNVKFDKPAASQFEAPSDYTKYDSIMSLMQQEMMKRMGNMQQQGR